jgi:gluconate 2-dehydrogenase gamma chain
MMNEKTDPPALPDTAISRRTFLNRLALLGSLAAAYPAALLAQRRAPAEAALPPAAWLTEDPWQTLAAVQQHLFPAAADTPGADDIGAIQYLHNAIENPDADGEDRTFVLNGVGWLNELTQEKYQQPFVALNEAEREDVLRQIEQSRAGRNWLSLLLTYLLEALLADPVYGGNPDGIGWQWLEHQPGYPTPPEDKLWYRLGERVTFRRKAT